MAAITVTTANKISVVESIIQMTLPAAEAILAGAPVRIDVSTGKFTNGNASSAAEARIYGVAAKTVPAGMPVTAIRKGVLDGFTTAGAYDQGVFLTNSDAGLDDTTGGTVPTVIGRIIPATAVPVGTANDKLLFIDL